MPQLSPEQELLEEPYAYEFFQAVRLLERIHPDEKRVGGEAMPHEEIVRFRSRVALDFPASEIHEMRKVIDETGQSERLEMLVNFMGVVGVSGALPTHYTEMVLDRIRHRDTTMWAFFDIFTHRVVSLFYRAWAKYRFPINYEAGDESFTAYLYDLAGLGTRGLRGRMAVEDEALLPYTGLIAQAPHTADSLANMISDHFRAKAKIEQFSGQWLLLDGRDVTQLGAKNSSLGRSAIVGTRVWDQQSKFRVRLGPLDLKRFQAFLPSGSAHEPLKSIVKFMVGDELDFDVQLVLEAKQVPATILTTRAIRRPSLGWTSFLKTKPFKEPDDQVVLKMAA